jgi:hypothetical protein
LHFVTAVRLKDGETEDRITSVRWLNGSDGVAGTSTTEAMVTWIDKGNKLYVGAPDGKVSVGVVRPKTGSPYLRAYANKEWTDNLRQLPRF